MKRILATLMLIAAVGIGAHAQPSEGTPGGSPTPIDGGLSLLLAAGAALGGKKAYDAYRHKEDDAS